MFQFHLVEVLSGKKVLEMILTDAVTSSSAILLLQMDTISNIKSVLINFVIQFYNLIYTKINSQRFG